MARVYKDGEEYPEEEEYPEYVENSNTDKKNKNSSKVPIVVVETDPLELAAAQAEVKSVDIDGYLLDDEEQTKRYVLTYVCMYVCTNIFHMRISSARIPLQISHFFSLFFNILFEYFLFLSRNFCTYTLELRFGSKISVRSWMKELGERKFGMKMI